MKKINKKEDKNHRNKRQSEIKEQNMERDRRVVVKK